MSTLSPSAGGLRDNLRAILPPAPRALPEGTGPPAGVLLPLIDGPEPSLVFTKRTETLRRHAGEVSFPGGLPHREDGGDLARTALRETEEELGIDPAAVEILGTLSPLPTYVTGILIVPFVGALEERPAMRPNPAEIQEVMVIPVELLIDVEAEVGWDRGDMAWRGYLYEVDGHTIWGATGRILHEFLDLVRGATERGPAGVAAERGAGRG